MNNICSINHCVNLIEKGRRRGGVCNMHRHRFQRLGSYDLPFKFPRETGYLKECSLHGKLEKENIRTIVNKGKIFEYCKICRSLKKENPYLDLPENLTHRECRKCKKSKTKDLFTPSQWKLKFCICWTCRKSTQDKAYQKQKTRINHRELIKNYHLNKKFKISIECYKELLEKQKGLCAICLKPESRKIKNKISDLSVDHCHNLEKIGIIKVRGLLCFACNSALGKLDDNIENLKRAIIYLQQ